MKVLLIGEYSRLHNSLKEGLESLGHVVTLVAEGDYFKDYPADIKLKRRFEKGFLNKVKIAIYKTFGINITSLDLYFQFLRHAKYLKNHDVVQLINERPFRITGIIAVKIIDFLFKNNGKIHLLACGTDYISVKYAYDKKFRYSILTPYFEKKVTKKQFANIFSYLSPESKEYHFNLTQKISGITASDIDYVLPYLEHSKFKGLIPNPINTDKIRFIENYIEEKIVIFHGVNRNNFYKKGNDIFEEALKIIEQKYIDKVEIIVTENVPYQQYIRSYNKAHILLDQVYAYDQGYNALEAMAKGKVVFTGAEKEFLEHYHLVEDEVCINALPNVNYLVEKLSLLIENPYIITKISLNARDFIEEEHHYVKIAQKYIDIYNS